MDNPFLASFCFFSSSRNSFAFLHGGFSLSGPSPFNCKIKEDVTQFTFKYIKRIGSLNEGNNPTGFG